MKELYTSPEAKLTCFAPVENLANDGIIDFENDLLNPGGSTGGISGATGNVTPVIPGEDDMEFGA